MNWFLPRHLKRYRDIGRLLLKHGRSDIVRQTGLPEALEEGEASVHSEGARFHPDLELPDDTEIVSKGIRSDRDNYSAFDRTALADELRHAGIQRVFVGGLAQDVCVRQTALDARRSGFEVHLIQDATRPVDPQQAPEANREMVEAGVILESTEKR